MSEPRESAADADGHALWGVWEQHQAEVLTKLGLLEKAVAVLGSDRFDDQLRAETQRSAHMLSGSLGMFGFIRSSEAAHELELELAHTGHSRAPTLSTLLAIIRRGLDTEGFVARAGTPARLQAEETGMLVVDEDPELRRRIADACAARGTRCETVSTSKEARALCSRRAPEIVLIGLAPHGEEMDEAFALLGELSSATPPIPVLLLTDRPAFAERVQAVRGGSCAFLPRSLPADELLGAIEQLQDRRRLAATRVLVVDDDPAVLEVMRSLLAPHDLDVFTLADPLRFWETLEEVIPELLILDVDMPGVSGPELCRTVRGDPRWRGVAVIFIAARGDPEAVELAFNAGADDYVVKSTLGPEFVSRISNRLERVRLFRAEAENDGLTGLSNRVTTEEGIKQLVTLSDRFSEPLSVVMLDIDRFKQVNDTHGHAAGDTVLRRVASYLRREFRGNDVVGRWGGEEFVIGMYGMTRANAVRRLSDIQERFSTEEFQDGAGSPFTVSFSAGVAEYPLDGTDADGACRAADEALYRAKVAGRARVKGARPAPLNA